MIFWPALKKCEIIKYVSPIQDVGKHGRNVGSRSSFEVRANAPIADDSDPKFRLLQ